MPNWQPNMQNVRWNQDVANQAAEALRRAAEELERTALEREHAAREATAQWRGAHRTVFDAHLQAALRRARELAAEYHEAAKRIAQANDRARNDQARRDGDRARWHQEQETEQRREREFQAAQRNPTSR